MKKVLTPRKPKFKKPKEFIGFDIETDARRNHEIICISIANDEFRKTFYDPDEFIDEISRRKYRDYHFVATNVVFDFFGVFQDIPEHVSMTERNGRIYKLTYHQSITQKGRTNNIHFYDTLNYFPASVQKLGSIVNVPKMTPPKCFPNRPESEAEYLQLEKYCENDAYISYKFMNDIYVKWLEENDLQFKTTMASTALIDFRTNDLKTKLFVNNEEMHNIIFSAYYGGRTETFKRGYAKNVNCYDFNSLYPTVMRGMMPDPNSAKHIKQISDYTINNYTGFSYVEGFQEKTYIPVLPVKHEGKLVFPTGEIKGFYSHMEIKKAQENGFKVHKYGEGVIFTRELDLFTSYVNRHYNKRLVYKAENNPLEVMEKLAMNSLYGKFGFNYRSTSSYQHKDQKLDLSNWEDTTIIPCGDYIYFKAEGCTTPTAYSFPELSAHITAKARLKLYDELVKYQDTLLYCDTDSVFIQTTMEESNQLGGLKLEEGYPKKECVFVRGKFYKTDDLIKCKGVTRMTPEQWDKVLKGETIYQNRFVKHRTAIRSQILKTQTLRVNQEITVKKNLSLEDEKRKWQIKFNPKKLQDSMPLHNISLEI